MFVGIEQLQDALVHIAGEFDMKCDGGKDRVAVGDVVDGVAISKSRAVHLRRPPAHPIPHRRPTLPSFSREVLAQLIRTLLNEMKLSHGRVVCRLPVKPDWAMTADSFDIRDDKTGAVFEIYTYKRDGWNHVAIASAWGST